MFDHIEKFHKMPPEIKEKFSNDEVLANLTRIERKYGIDLASIVIKTAIREINARKLVPVLEKEFSINEEKAHKIFRELLDGVFYGARDYLKIKDLYPREKKKKEKKKEAPKTKPKKMLEEYDHDGELHELSIYGKGGEVAPPASKQEKEDIEKRIDAIIGRLKVNFITPERRRRFVNIVKIYLKGGRTAMMTKDTLVKPFEKGGLGVSRGLADKIIGACDGKSVFKEREKDGSKKEDKSEFVELPSREHGIADQGSEKESEKEDASGKGGFPELSEKEKEAIKDDNEEGVDLESALGRLEDDEPADKKPEDGKRLDLEALPQRDFEYDLSALPKKKKDESADKSKEEDGQEEKKEKEKKVQPRIPVKREKAANKASMEDIKKPKVTNPISEIRHMDLVFFRRLGGSAAERAERIKKKINEIGETEGFAKRVEAIKAWRENPINKMYINIGRNSIINNKKVEEIIKEKQAENDKFLTKDEFEEIMKLNSELRKY